MRLNKAILAAAALAALPAIANASFFALGTSSSVAPTANVAITAAPGETVTLYLWGRATGTTAGAYVNAYSFRVEGTGLAPSAATFGGNTAPATHAGPDIVPSAGAATATAGIGTTFALFNGAFGKGSTAAQTGINATPLNLASFTFTVPAGAANNAVSSLFLFTPGITENSTSGNRHGLGFGGTSTLNNGTLTGVDGNIVNTSGVTTTNSNGFSPVTANVRTALPEAVITVVAASAVDTLTLSAGAAANATATLNVPGSVAAGFPLAVVSVGTNSGEVAINFGSAPGTAIVAYDISGGIGSISGLLPVAGSPFAALFPGFNFYQTLTAAGSTFNVDFDLPEGSVLNRVGAIPEPTALGLLAPVAFLAARRRRA